MSPDGLDECSDVWDVLVCWVVAEVPEAALLEEQAASELRQCETRIDLAVLGVVRPRLRRRLVQLRGFVRATQDDIVDALSLDADGPARRAFLARLQGEISKRGTI